MTIGGVDLKVSAKPFYHIILHEEFKGATELMGELKEAGAKVKYNRIDAIGRWCCLRRGCCGGVVGVGCCGGGVLWGWGVVGVGCCGGGVLWEWGDVGVECCGGGVGCCGGGVL